MRHLPATNIKPYIPKPFSDIRYLNTKTQEAEKWEKDNETIT